MSGWQSLKLQVKVARFIMKLLALNVNALLALPGISDALGLIPPAERVRLAFTGPNIQLSELRC